jgi:hypothetical protein
MIGNEPGYTKYLQPALPKGNPVISIRVKEIIMGTMVSSFDTYGITEILYNIRLLLFISDALLVILAGAVFFLIFKLLKKPKSPQ